ncbi:MAG: ABC transporter permease [Planctomycetes bacterium]|nr:ABC transporter permease [Planctomycetota bacterium]
MLGPIFDRERLTLPRRSRHYLTRALYLGALWILLLTIWQAVVGWDVPATLGDTARFGRLAFGFVSYVQLVLLFFFAALSAASTIAQEKDRRTFVLLLLTDLRNYEIVLGKLVGSLLQIGLLLAGTVPFLGLLILLGGIAPMQVVEASTILATTALTAGSLGGLIALWREKTFQSLALTVLLLVLYLCVVQALALVPAGMDLFHEGQTWVTAADVGDWQNTLNPLLALAQVLDPQEEYRGLRPAFRFGFAMIAMTLLINAWAMARLRAWNPRGDPIMQREGSGEEDDKKDRARAHAAPGAARKVWANPILWREIATRAYGRKPLLVKLAYFLVLGLICYFALSDISSFWAKNLLIPFVGTLSLLLVSAQAVTSITSERDLGALDLLLVTDLSPREFLFGKLLGILYNTKEYLLPPIALAGIYAFKGLLASPPTFGGNLEAFLAISVAILILFAFAIVLGLHVGLRNDNSRVSITSTLGTIFFLSVGTGVCMWLILINGRFEYQWLSFSGFIFAGVAGLWWVLSGDKPSPALTLASWFCPLAVFYSVTNLIIGRPGTDQTADPLYPFLVISGAFGFTLAAMLVPLLSEFDVAIGRTSAAGE